MESKQFAGGRPVTTGRAGGIPRAPTANNQDDQPLGSARSKAKDPAQVAFGKNYRSGSAATGQRPPSAQSKLNLQNLQKLDRRNNSNIGIRKPVDPEVVVFTGEEAKVAAASAA